jgi:predicted AAA+ superfamily ATPase
MQNALKRIVKHPKGYFRDSGLLHYLLRIPDVDLLATHPVMGRSWEGLVINNDECPRLYDEKIAGIPVACL